MLGKTREITSSELILWRIIAIWNHCDTEGIENPLVGVVASIIVAVAAEYNYSKNRSAAAAANCSSDYVEF